MDSKKKDTAKLFSEFPPVLTEQWEEKIKKDLKGADYDKKLIWKTNDNFNVKPYYRSEDLKSISYLDVFPGDFPFARGNKKNNNDWYIRQDIDAKDIIKANKKALDVLMKGINSLGLILDDKTEPSIEGIERLLENIFADAVELNFICGDYCFKVLEIVETLVKNYNRDLEKIKGSVDFDPLGYFSLRGNFTQSEKFVFDSCVELIKKADHLPYYRVIAVNGQIFNNSGSSIVEELAFSLAAGSEYLTQLTNRGLTIDEVALRIKFNFAVGSNYFMEIAKIRAARTLWANIVNAYGPEHIGITQMHVHSVTSDWNKTIYDPYVNMLRTTTEAMSSIIGGTDSLMVKGFNTAYEKPTDFSERIARSQQLLLKEESYFDKVVDPVAGSYYVENLTNSIAEEAWKLFLEVDESGGYLEAFKKGFIQSKIKETARKKDLDIATRKVSLLGTNQFPNFNEHIDKELNPSIFEPENLTGNETIVETLKPYRGAQAFEILRYKTDMFAIKNKRPVVFMFTYGNPAIRKARAIFSCNFFACAGFEVFDNPGFKTIDEGIKSCINTKADIVVICSSDDEYAEIAPEIFNRLKDKAIIVVAGYPKNIIDELKAKGIQHFVHVKSNVLETLRKFQEEVCY